MGEMIVAYTKADINAAIDKTRVERFRLLCWRHPDLRTRAGYQALVLKNAAGMTGNLTPTEEERRATPAGQKIPADESPLIQVTCKRCGGNRCEPDDIRGIDGEILWLEADAE